MTNDEHKIRDAFSSMERTHCVLDIDEKEDKLIEKTWVSGKQAPSFGHGATTHNHPESKTTRKWQTCYAQMSVHSTVKSSG